MITQLYDCFKHWAEKGAVYILSDPHFGDPDCKLIDKNWISPDEQVNIINNMCHKDDTFICLGDCGDLSYIQKLKAGLKVLIKGNHDDKGNDFYKTVFDEVYSGPLFISEKILLSHEPIMSGGLFFNLCGHDHDLKGDGKWWNVWDLAANVANYTPINLGKEIKKGMLKNIKGIHRITIDDATKRKKET